MDNPNAVSASRPLTLLCLASFEKGHDFLKEAKRQGCRVFLLTSLSIRDTANFSREDLDDIFYMPDVDHEWNMDHTLRAVAHLCRKERVDRVVPLDDFDLEKASFLRENLRIPGLGESATRYFRDKLAMRMRARENDIPVPPFTATINYHDITNFVDSVPGPWLLKPRLMAGAIGIKKYDQRHDVWDRIHTLGDDQINFVLELFVPGDIFHVDSIWFRGEMTFAVTSGYGTPPLEVTHGGGIFTTRLLERDADLDRRLRELNRKVLTAFELRNGVSHTEFIRSHADGSLYFLETSARVGGAHISDLIEAGTGINLWAEWAKVEIAESKNIPYLPPASSNDYAGLLVSLARQEWPDTSSFKEPEVVWKLHKRHHVGLIVKSPDKQRVEHLLGTYCEVIRNEYHAFAPPRESVRE